MKGLPTSCWLLILFHSLFSIVKLTTCDSSGIQADFFQCWTGKRNVKSKKYDMSGSAASIHPFLSMKSGTALQNSQTYESKKYKAHFYLEYVLCIMRCSGILQVQGLL